MNEDVKQMMYINGVKRRPISCGDSYHCANLGVMHASHGMTGDTVNGKHEQIHHRQVLMSIHSLHSDDSAYSQAMMDRVMSDSDMVATLKTWRERQQQWLVNHRYATYVLLMLDLLSSDGVVCLVAWGLWFSNYSRSDWKRRVGREVAMWFMMPAIILAINFESELGNYFEQAYS